MMEKIEIAINQVGRKDAPPSNDAKLVNLVQRQMQKNYPDKAVAIDFTEGKATVYTYEK